MRRAGRRLSRGEARPWGPETKARGSDSGHGGHKPRGSPGEPDEMFATPADRARVGIWKETRWHAHP